MKLTRAYALSLGQMRAHEKTQSPVVSEDDVKQGRQACDSFVHSHFQEKSWTSAEDHVQVLLCAACWSHWKQNTGGKKSSLWKISSPILAFISIYFLAT